MTQVIAAMSADYVFVASDMKLTELDANGMPTLGSPLPDECKLVNTANIFGIGYTGWAKLAGIPAHEWIGMRIAEMECMDAKFAAAILKDTAPAAMPVGRRCIPQEFVIAGWVLGDGGDLHARMYLVSNCFHADGQGKSAADAQFEIFQCDHRSDVERVTVKSVGFHLPADRQLSLTRKLSRLMKKRRSPSVAMNVLAEEIVHTSNQLKVSSVGEKIMVFCLPKRGARRTIETGHAKLVSGLPVSESDMSSFCYFELDGRGLRHYGPTFTCRGSAVTDLEGHNSPNQITMKFRKLR